MEHTGTKVVLRDVFKAFGTNGSVKSVLNGLDLDLRTGEFTTLVGPNGCGKTSLVSVVAGHVAPDSGTFEIRTSNGHPAQVGYVWQNYRASLLPWLDVFDNVAFPLRLRGTKKEEREQRVKDLLDRFLPGVDPKKPCYELSGGQQQMLCIIRSATIKPDVLLLDEPFSALDQRRSWAMALYVEQLWLERRPPTLFVSHDVDEAILLADRIAMMGSSGRIEKTICNRASRPRTLESLTSQEHLQCRAEVVGFLQAAPLEGK